MLYVSIRGGMKTSKKGMSKIIAKANYEKLQNVRRQEGQRMVFCKRKETKTLKILFTKFEQESLLLPAVSLAEYFEGWNISVQLQMAEL